MFPSRFSRWFDRITIGFWLGGLALGTGGCVLGGWRYGHPVGVAAGMLWWGIYLGSFGASLGALIGLWTDGTPKPPSRDVGEDATGEAEATPSAIRKCPRYVPMPTPPCVTADRECRITRPAPTRPPGAPAPPFSGREADESPGARAWSVE
jgi:hypothetical protein